MLHDPSRDRISPHPPSLESFTIFVKLKAMFEPDGRYDWTDPQTCAVGSYLQSIGIWDGDDDWFWYSGQQTFLMELDDIAEGGYWRDNKGRFVSSEKQVGNQWTWAALAKRLDKVSYE